MPPDPYEKLPQQPAAQPPPPPGWGVPAPYAAYPPLPPGPIGRQRSTGLGVVLYIVTLGIYGYVWQFQIHEEMKEHSREGVGGVVALVLWFFLGTLAMGFITPIEIEKLYARQGLQSPVTWATGLWATLGILLCGIGPIIWYVQVNGALNEYWRSLGAPNP